jgi:hypothetical protein
VESAIESADAAYLSSVANYDFVLVTLLDVATTYIGIRTLQTRIQIARENIVKQKKALAIPGPRRPGLGQAAHACRRRPPCVGVRLA